MRVRDNECVCVCVCIWCVRVCVWCASVCLYLRVFGVFGLRVCVQIYVCFACECVSAYPGGGYMALELFFVSARTNKRQHHYQAKKCV